MIKLASQYDNLELSPTSKKLLKKIDALTMEFAKLAVEYDHLVITVIPNVESEYQVKIGKKEYDLFYIGTEVVRIKRKINLIQVEINKGKIPDITAINISLDVEFEKWQKKIKQLHDKLNEAEILKNAEKLSLDDNVKLQKLYRELVKRLHPDINPNLTAEEKKLWLRVITAYKRGDLSELEVLATLLEKRICIDEIHNPSLLHQKHSDLKQKVKLLIVQIGELHSTHPLNMQENFENSEWVESKQNELNEKIEILSKEKGRLSIMLDKMVEE